MTATELTTLLGVIVALCSSVGVPLYLGRRKDKREQRRLEVKRQADLADDVEVSWESINKALVRERDRLTDRLDKMETEHADEISQLRTEHRAELDALRLRLTNEAAEIKKRYDAEISELRKRLTICQEKVRELTFEIHDLQKKLPPV